MAGQRKARRTIRAWLLGTAAALPPAGAALAQGPAGGQVVGGSAAIAQTPARTTVTQSSDRAAIDWRRFDVGPGHEVAFRQPAATSWTLNRVTGPDPSVIAGRITANGGVALVNPSGMVFAEGSQVNVASLIASAATITTPNFMAGRMVFDGPPKPGARIENRGTVTVADRGLAALVAPEVANSGTIRARLGRVALAGAETYALDLAGDGLLSIDVTEAVRRAPAGGVALVTNSGTIEAAGGSVLLTAQAASGLVETLVSNPGRIAAPTVGARTGTVAVRVEGGGARVSGSITATGGADRKGGTVEVNASRAVTLAPGATVDVSAAAGGGRAFVGTTGAGRGQRVAARTEVAEGAAVRADATRKGQGGTIAVNARESTVFLGEASARGGPEGGDGGLVELSGQGRLEIRGTVDVRAPAGSAGTLLLDPLDLVVTQEDDPEAPPLRSFSALFFGSGEAGIVEADSPVLPSGQSAIAVPAPIRGNPRPELDLGGPSLPRGSGRIALTAEGGLIAVGNGSIENFTGNVALEAQRNLAVLAPVNKINGGLTLLAQTGVLQMDAPVAATTLALTGDLVRVGAGLTASGGGISLSGGARGVATTAAGSLTAAGPIALAAAGPIAVAGAMATTTGGISLASGAGAVTTAGTAAMNAPGAIAITGPAGVTADGAILAGGAVTLSTGGASPAAALSNTGAINAGAGIALTGAGPVTNAGPLLATAGDVLLGGGRVENSGAIQGAGTIRLQSTGALVNRGAISGQALQVTGATVDNQAPLAAVGDLSIGATTPPPDRILSGGPLLAGGTVVLRSTDPGGAGLDIQAPITASRLVMAGSSVRIAAPLEAPGGEIGLTAGTGGLATTPAGRLSARSIQVAPGAAPGPVDFGAPLGADSIGVVGASLRLGAGLTATGDLSAFANRTNLAIPAGAIVSAGGDVSLRATTTLDNNGTVSAGRVADLRTIGPGAALTNAGTVTGGAGALLEVFGTGGRLLNNGLVTAGNAQAADPATPGPVLVSSADRSTTLAGPGAVLLIGAGGGSTIANTGAIAAGPGGARLVATGGITNGGTIATEGGSLALLAGGPLANDAGSLSAPAGAVALQGDTASLSGGITAGNGLAVNSGAGLPAFGPATLVRMSGARIAADTVTIRAPGGVDLGDSPALSTLVALSPGARPSLAIDTQGAVGAPAGDVRLNLDAGAGFVTLRIGAGAASGTLQAGALEVVGRGGSADLTGVLAGRTGGVAARSGTLTGPANDAERARYLFNDCVIGAPVCGGPPLPPTDPSVPKPRIGVPPGEIPLDPYTTPTTRRAAGDAAATAAAAAAGRSGAAAPELVRLRRSRGRLTDPDIVLPNATEEDY